LRKQIYELTTYLYEKEAVDFFLLINKEEREVLGILASYNTSTTSLFDQLVD
jgi:hypothetical protein